ncbi:MAG: zinc ribbon domain-containing protein [Candidatus Absconditabacterales bacterium]
MKPCETQCQSCGLPLDKDPQGGGTQKDGSKSTIYCSLCYKDGAFIGGDCTLEQMQDIVEKSMKQQGYGRIMRKMARRQIPRLQRRKK